MNELLLKVERAMFKVECPGCRAPYQVDERRVPSTGLKMRCPKCGTSFQVDQPSDPRKTGPSPVLGGPVPRPGADAPAPRPIPKGTMIGVAPAFAAKPAEPPKPALPDAYGEMDLPTVGTQGTPAARPVPRPGAGGPPPVPQRIPRAEVAPAPAANRGIDQDDLDLPAARGPATGLSAAAQPAAPAPPDFSDLPAVPRGAPAKLDLDLPAVGGARPQAEALAADLPSPRPPGAMASSAAKAPSISDPFGELELPALSELELPSPRGPARPETRRDLPKPGGGFDLPSPVANQAAGGAFHPELDLPAAPRAGLPAAPTRADLPVATQAGLPAPSAGLPSIAPDSLPTPAAALPSHKPSVPDARSAFDLDPLDDGSFDLEAPARARKSSAPPISSGAGQGHRFGEIDLGGGAFPEPTSAAPARSALSSDSSLEADPFGPAALVAPTSAPEPRRSQSAFAATQIGSAPPPSAEAITRASGGGVSYGEVNLDGGGGAEMPIEAAPEQSRLSKPPPEESMEFGGIPQEAAPQAMKMPATAAEPAAPRASRRKLGVRVFAGLFVIAVGGSALALVPDVGPFGAYWIGDRLKADEYARLLADTASQARRALGRDTALDAQKASAIAEAAQHSAKRVPGLKAHAAFVGYVRELRFGVDAPVRARAKVLLDELAEVESAPYLRLARAAQSAVEGDTPRAKTLLTSLERENPRDPDVLIVKGEIALREADPKALAAWQAADQIEHSARTAYGIARAEYAAGSAAASEKSARRALEQNPQHVGARILLARLVSQSRPLDPTASAMLESIVKEPAGASQQEVVLAQTLLGDIHLSRSRISLAEAAYKAALKIDPTAGRALSGLGEAVFRAGRYSEALARFEAATQATPNDLDASVGVAKSKLLLERADDALGTLRKLSQAHPKSAKVAYWFGRALEALGSRDQALGVYVTLLKSPPREPAVVDVYVALALLQNQMGEIEQAKRTLQTASDANPGSPAVHRALGDVALGEGRYPDAVIGFQRALELDAGDLAARFKLGVTQRRQGKFEEASKTFDEVARSDQEYPGLALERGLLFEAAGRTDEALKAYEAALAKAPNDPDLMLRVGCGNVAAGRAQDGEQLLRKVMAARPNSAETNHCLGRSLLLQNRLADAQRLLDRAVELDPNRAEYHLYVGWVASDAGDFNKASTALDTALRLDQALADAYWQRGVLRSRRGAVRDAIGDLRKALELRPSRFEAHAALADALYDLGKEREALVEWQLAVAAQPDNALWRFRYGRLLVVNQQAEPGKEQLGKAIEAGEKQVPPPRWLWEAHHMMARALGELSASAPHWEAFLRLGPRDSPYRGEAKAVLGRLGKPWSGP